MPTAPVVAVLPRASGNPRLDAILAEFSDGVDELVNFGTHVFKECAGVSGGLELVGPMMLFRHALELLDSVSCLLRVGLADPCKPLLRCVFDASVGAQYMLAADPGRRGRAYYAHEHRSRLRQLKQLDLGREEGKQFRATIKRDRLCNSMQIDPPARLQERISKMEAVLKTGSLAEVGAELDALRKGGRRNPAWHELFGGPQSIEGVATAVGLPAVYDVMYRYWSGFTHGSGVHSGRIKGGLEESAVTQLRYPESAQEVLAHALLLGTDMMRFIVEALVPSFKPQFVDWYVREMQGRIKMAHGEPRINIAKEVAG